MGSSGWLVAKRDAGFLLDLRPIGHSRVFGDVSHSRGLDCRGVRVLPNDLLHQRVLHRSHVDANVRP